MLKIKEQNGRKRGKKYYSIDGKAKYEVVK